MTGIRDIRRVAEDDVWNGRCAPGIRRMGGEDVTQGVASDWLASGGERGSCEGSFWNGRFEEFWKEARRRAVGLGRGRYLWYLGGYFVGVVWWPTDVLPCALHGHGVRCVAAVIANPGAAILANIDGMSRHSTASRWLIYIDCLDIGAWKMPLCLLMACGAVNIGELSGKMPRYCPLQDHPRAVARAERCIRVDWSHVTAFAPVVPPLCHIGTGWGSRFPDSAHTVQALSSATAALRS